MAIALLSETTWLPGEVSQPCGIAVLETRLLSAFLWTEAMGHS